MLELATLGLLQKEALHGYKLKQQLERFISGCISVNYAITEKGKARFQEKMLEHPKEIWVNGRSRFLVKFVFFSKKSGNPHPQSLIWVGMKAHQSMGFNIPLIDNFLICSLITSFWLLPFCLQKERSC